MSLPRSLISWASTSPCTRVSVDNHASRYDDKEATKWALHLSITKSQSVIPPVSLASIYESDSADKMSEASFGLRVFAFYSLFPSHENLSSEIFFLFCFYLIPSLLPRLFSSNNKNGLQYLPS